MADFADMILGSLAYDPFGTAAPQIDFPPETEDVPQQPPVQAPAREAQPRQRVRLGPGLKVRCEPMVRYDHILVH